MGKTANLEYLRVHLLKKNIPVYSYELKWLNTETKAAFKKEIKSLDSFLKDTVVMLDGYDEMDWSMKNTVDKLINEELKGKCKLCIVGSRVASIQIEEDNSRVEEEDDLNETLFSGFETARLCPFERAEILARIQRENEKGIGYFPLLRNTMFLLMHCEFERLKKERSDFPDIITEADFIEYLNTCVFPDRESKMIKNLGWTDLGKNLPEEYRNIPYYNF